MHASPRLLSPGRLIVTALLLAMTASCQDTNVTTVGASQITISPPSTSVKVGDTTRLSATVLSSDGVPLTGRIIQWTSLDSNASVDATGLVSGLSIGMARIRASAEGASGTAQVNVTSGPAIQASPATVEFVGVRNGANPGDRVVAISNTGDGTLSGLAVSVAYAPGGPTGWLSAALAGTTAPATLVLGATIGSLNVGTYSATVTVTSPVASNSPITVPVQLQVQGAAAAIALGTSSVSFNAVQGGTNPAPQTVTVTNAGGGTLSGLGVSVNYTAGPQQGWLNATLGASTAPTTVTLTATTAALPAGNYSATVRVTSPLAQNSPQDINVNFTVGAAPAVITAQPTSITVVGTSTTSRQIQLTNTGGGTLSGMVVTAVYTTGQPSGWITTSLSSTTAPATLTVNVTPGSLAPGTYTAVARVTGPGAANSPLDIPVQLQVPTPAPAISLASNSASFNAVQGGGDPASQSVSVTNGGGGTLSGLGVSVSYASGQPTGWLNASVGATTAPTSITLTATTGALTAGTYNATVQVASGVAQNSPQSITVSFTVTARPAAIGVQPTSLTFSGVSPANQTVQITNTGGGTLSGLTVSMVYPSGQPSGWLTTSLNGTTAPATLTVGVNTSGLAAGTYTATARITAAGASNSPVDVPVQLTVPQPVIGAQPTSLTFSGVSPTNQTVQIANTGGATLSGLAVSAVYPSGQPSGWLTTSLNATTAPATLTVGVNTAGLAAGTYTATARITAPGASNSPMDVPVQLTVPPPAITLNNKTVSFNATQGAGDPASQTVAVANAGGSTLSGLSVSVTYAGGQSTGWLSASLGSTTAPTNITLTASIGALQAGTYNATVHVTSAVASNSPQDISVTFTVGAGPPSIGAQPAGLVFTGVSPADQPILITNTGGGALNGLSVTVVYTPGQPTGWLSTGLSGTTAPATLTVGATGASLAPGTYNATIRISGTGAVNSPLDVPVQLNVPTPAPAIGLGANVVGFNAVAGAGDPAAQTVSVSNAGGGTLSGLSVSVNYGVGQPSGWLSATLGTTTAPTDITLTAATGSLPAGTYTATVQVLSSVAANSPQNISVTFNVAAPQPAISLGNNSIGFNAVEGGGNPASQTVAVANSGGGTLSGLSATVSYASGQPTGWLSATLGSTTAPTDVTLTAATAGLVAGTYNATVQLSSGVAQNSPLTIAVTFTVAAPQAAIGVQPTSVTFNGVTPADQQVQITNTGGGTLSGIATSTVYASGQPTGWLTANLSSTTAPATLTIGANGSSLPAGTYSATVQVSAAGAANTPVDVGVTFTVPDPAPGAPTGVTATAVSTSQIDVTWTAPGGTVTSYNIERKIGAGGTYAQLQNVSGATTSISDSGLAPGTEYFYRVQACNTGGCSSFSTEASATTQSGTPNLPTLTAQAISISTIDLQWSHDGLLVTHFELERAPGTDPSNFASLATPSAAARSHQDAGLSSSTLYVYRIRACALVLCSGWSNVASATTQTPAPAIPTNVSAVALDSTHVQVTWDAVAGATSYDVRRRNAAGGAMTQTINVAAPNTVFIDSSASPRTSYNYDVRACNAGGCSNFSSVSLATTP